MRKIIFIGVLGGVLSACGGAGDEDSTSSSSTTSAVAVSSVPSSFSGDATAGASLFASKCSACHADTNGDGYFGVGDSSGDAGGTAALDPDALGDPSSASYPSYDGDDVQALATFIEEEMGPLADCDEQCGLDTAAYIWTLKDGRAGPAVAAASCANPGAIHYGKRVLHVLTSYEYHNSLSQLFNDDLPADYSSPSKVSPDTTVARLPNNSISAINETSLGQYYDSAGELADWAASNPDALPFACEDPVTCAEDFINEFAYVAYRRALTDEERTELTNIFTEAPSLTSGITWAIKTVLMSPNFLYRSELGTEVAELIENPVVAQGNRLTFDGTPTTYSDLSINAYSRITVGSDSLDYEWTGNDLIAISVKGEKSEQDNWPLMTVGSGVGEGTGFDEVTVNHTGFRTYYFTIDEIPDGGVFFLNDANGAGNDYTMPPIEVASVSVGPLGSAEPVEDDVEKLAAADQSAYVLDPYEYASALSFALTGSGPSKSLLDAAVAGELVDPASRELHVDALIDSDLGRAHVERLGGKWFNTDNLISVTRNNDEFTQEVRQSMMQEVREIYKHVFYNGDFPSMYTGDFTYLDSTLADFYGLSGGGSAPGEFSLVDTSDSARGGMIASGAYMALNAHMDYTSPIHRSVHFRQDALCQAIPLPINLGDDEARAEAEQIAKARLSDGDISTAEYFDIQTNVPGTGCAQCHNAVINPLFGIDDFDNVGRLRARAGESVVQTGLVVDDNGVVVPQGEADVAIEFVNSEGYLYGYDVVGTLSTTEADAAKASGDGLAFSGAKDLGKVMVENNLPGMGACLIEKTARYALGYSLDRALLQPEEVGIYGISNAQDAEFACIKNELNSAYASGQSPRDVLKALVMSDSFRFRK